MQWLARALAHSRRSIDACCINDVVPYVPGAFRTVLLRFHNREREHCPLSQACWQAKHPCYTDYTEKCFTGRSFEVLWDPSPREADIWQLPWAPLCSKPQPGETWHHAAVQRGVSWLPQQLPRSADVPTMEAKQASVSLSSLSPSPSLLLLIGRS